MRRDFTKVIRAFCQIRGYESLKFSENWSVLGYAFVLREKAADIFAQSLNISA